MGGAALPESVTELAGARAELQETVEAAVNAGTRLSFMLPVA